MSTQIPQPVVDPGWQAPNGIVMHVLGDDCEWFVSFGHHNKAHFLRALNKFIQHIGADFDEVPAEDAIEHTTAAHYQYEDEWGLSFSHDDQREVWVTVWRSFE